VNLRSPVLERVLLLVIIGAGLGDIPRLVRLGPVTFGAVYSVLLVLIIAGGLVLCRAFPRHLLLRLSPWLAFLLWLTIRSIWTPPNFYYGVQHVLVFLVFGLCLLMAGLLASRNSDWTVHLIDSAMRRMGVLALGLAGFSIATKGLLEPWLINQRVVAVLGLAPVSWYLMRLYFDVPHSLAPVTIWLAVIALSSSRTATAIGMLLLVLVTLLKVWRRRSGSLGAVSLVLLVAGGTAVLFLRVPEYRDHLLEGDTSDIAVGSVGINANGRVVVWQAVMKSGEESPIVGKGVGASSVFVSWRTARVLEHPHNDYLRMWYDLGWIGLGLFLWALLSWAVILGRGWFRPSREGKPAAYTQLAGLLALLSLMLVMVTDNVVVYAGVMGVMGILLGAGLGTRSSPCMK
jgi:O-antigen ligase